MSCSYCEAKENNFIPANQTVDYSGIEIAINRQGLLRTRVFNETGDLVTQDIVEIRYCPLCGKKFRR